ncbi:MAG: hypothetical protein LBB39_02020 [Mycoplasmataceae bacterium]|nr:hypothetical protein [Mycoplasmataceae bacterium]
MKNNNINQYIEDVKKAANRETSTAWFEGKPGVEQMLYHEQLKKVNQNFAFSIVSKINNNTYKILTRNKIDINYDYEILSPLLQEIKKIKIIKILNKGNESVSIIPSPMVYAYVTFEEDVKLKKNDIVRIVL